MRIPAEKIEIPAEKITDYLLIKKAKNDKSAFLAQLGYHPENWNDLVNDIRNMVAQNEARLQRSTPFGDLYEVMGSLKAYGVVTIWLLAVDAEKYRFITLYPE